MTNLNDVKKAIDELMEKEREETFPPEILEKWIAEIEVSLRYDWLLPHADCPCQIAHILPGHKNCFYEKALVLETFENLRGKFLIDNELAYQEWIRGGNFCVFKCKKGSFYFHKIAIPISPSGSCLGLDEKIEALQYLHDKLKELYQEKLNANPR